MLNENDNGAVFAHNDANIHLTDIFNLDKVIAKIAHWLPSQGPIKDFIHHNTLHAVQHLPFHYGVALAGKMLGARSYLPITDYQKRHRQGRIHEHAITWALDRTGLPLQQQSQLRTELFRQDDNCHYPPVSLANQGIRNAWLKHIGQELDLMTHPILFRLLGNFLDQGISRWSLPKDGEAFWDCVVRLSQNSLLPLYPFNHPAVQGCLLDSPDQAILHCLDRIVGSDAFYEQYLLEMLLAHPGWSGLVSVIEQNPRSLLAARNISLKELLAVELVCELAFLHNKAGFHFVTIADTPLPSGTTLPKNGLPKPAIPLPLKVWHEAMEWSLHTELLTALKSEVALPKTARTKPYVQAFFCIDDRECSLPYTDFAILACYSAHG